MEKKGYLIENVYQGGYSTFRQTPLSPYFKTSQLGLTTKPSPDILTEVGKSISSGLKQIEIEMLSPDIVDSIPKQHTEETKRLAKLTGIEISVHGPVVDTSGIDSRGGGFSEINRLESEKRITQALLRAHELNPDGNIPVNFHSAEGIPGSQLLPPDKRTDETSYRRILAVNRETGKIIPLDEEERYYPGSEIRKEILTPEHRLKMINATEWDNSLFQVEVNRENAERIMADVHPLQIARYVQLEEAKLAASQGKVPESELKKLWEKISQEERAEFSKIRSADNFVRQAKLAADSLFSKAVELADRDKDEEKMKFLRDAARQYSEAIGMDGKRILDPEAYLNPKIHADALQQLEKHLDETTPQTYVKIDDFAAEQSSKTFGNSAFEAYKKFGEKTPLLTIENPPAGFALSTGEDLKNLVEKSRNEFAKKARKEFGLSEKEAQEKAAKFIGATWDVGHINMLRKYGYTEKDLIEETKKIAPFVKHVHLSDNFGIEHTEIPMGMGNVPLKEMMEKLGKKGEEAKKIIEAGVWWTQFKRSPVPESLELIGSPIYNTGVSPYWSQAVGLQQEYFGGYGMMLPQINYETWGAGFSQLPSELGGSRQQAGGRMSGKPME